jgi:hypothetical protein
VVCVLVLVATLAVGLLGFASGLGPLRDRVASLVAALTIVLVVVLIVDLGRPRRGLITVGQTSLLRLRDSLNDVAQAP